MQSDLGRSEPGIPGGTVGLRPEAELVEAAFQQEQELS